MLPFPIFNLNWNWQHWHWQHFHIGNILKVILIYIPVRSEGSGLAYNFHVTCFFLLSLLGDREAWSFGVFVEAFLNLQNSEPPSSESKEFSCNYLS